MFQETYNTVLWAARDAILQWSHLETPAFLAKSTDQDVTITNIQHLGIQTIQAFSLILKVCSHFIQSVIALLTA